MTQKDKYYQLLDQYVNGDLSGDARHELEKKALDDPFFFDAMEGWMEMGENVNHRKHLMSLLIKLKRKKQESLARRIIWPIAIAASLILLFTIGNIMMDDTDQPLASTTPEDVENLEIIQSEEYPSSDDQNAIAEESTSSEEISPTEREKPTTGSNLPPQDLKVKEEVASQQNRPAKPPEVINDVASTEADNSKKVATKEEKSESSSPLSKVNPPISMPLSNSKKALMKNNAVNDMAMSAGILEIIDPDLDNHINQNLFMRGLKVLSGQRNSYDITFDSTLTIKDIKLSSRKNDLSERIQEFILTYRDWKKETIPPNLYGRYNYPSKKE